MPSTPRKTMSTKKETMGVLKPAKMSISSQTISTENVVTVDESVNFQPTAVKTHSCKRKLDYVTTDESKKVAFQKMTLTLFPSQRPHLLPLKKDSFQRTVPKISSVI